MLKKIGIVLALLGLFSPLSAMAEQTMVASKTDTPPVIDGISSDAAWKSAPTVVSKDAIADIEVELQAVYTDEHLYLKARFPDATENREHKTLIWNDDLGTYRSGTAREDSFVIKWSMEPLPIDLSLKSEEPYRADIWYWKAFRTDPAGYADDKHHIYGYQEMKTAQQITLPSGKRMYLARPSDSGTSTYKSRALEEFEGDRVPRYQHRQPNGSRADVRAKGHWGDGYWTIEFQRKLNTGQADDIQFDPALTYRFGVSRFEIAGKAPNPKLEQPYYESGDISETLSLAFK